MNDRRVEIWREALTSLLDSMVATSRLERWDAAESVPESLKTSARMLDQHLAKANQLTSSGFVGSTLVVSRLNGISDAIRQLDRSLKDFRSRIEADPSSRVAALDNLDAELDQVKVNSERWV